LPKIQVRQRFGALPAYLGGKRRLCPLIFSLLSESLPRECWSASTLLDPFCGGGAVALYAKAQGLRVVASDAAERSAVVARALIANSSCHLRREDVLDLFRDPFEGYPRTAVGHSPAVFTDQQAEWLDRALARSDRRGEPIRSLLRLLIIKVALRLQPMSMLRGTDARAAATGDYDKVSPRRLGHYLKARRLLTLEGVWSVAQEVNAGVFGGRGEAHQGDAREPIARTQADVLYLDPPYAGTTAYDKEYAVLDDILGDGAEFGLPPSLDELLEAASHIPLVLLSYGGPTVNLDSLIVQVRRHRPVRRALAIPYPHLGSIASAAKTAENKEYIVVAG